MKRIKVVYIKQPLYTIIMTGHSIEWREDQLWVYSGGINPQTNLKECLVTQIPLDSVLSLTVETVDEDNGQKVSSC